MEHTKKFVLVDPRFVRPSMRDKALSGLDTDISNILNSDVSDEIKARNYVSALTRFKNYSDPPKPQEPKAAPAVPIVPPPPPPPHTSKAISSLKRPHKRVKVETLDTSPSLISSLRRRTQRLKTQKKFGPQWIEYIESPKKKKSQPTWIES